MAEQTEKLAPVALTKKQKNHVKRKAKKEGVPMTTIVRWLIEADIEESKRQ